MCPEPGRGFVEFLDVSVGYRDPSEILSGISFSIARGEICGILGPNGAGKSTLLKAMLRLGVRRSGGILLGDGRDVESLSRRDLALSVAYVPQDTGSHLGLTVMETVLLGRHPHRREWATDSDNDREIARGAMADTDTLQLASRAFGELSGGEKRLVLIAAALAQETCALVLDEPGASLDFRHQVALWVLLRKLADSGMSVLVTTHEISIAGQFMDRAVLIARGGMRACDRPSEVFTPELLSDAYGIPLDVIAGPGSSPLVVPHLEERLDAPGDGNG